VDDAVVSVGVVGGGGDDDDDAPGSAPEKERRC
jgi:hypothetical protein